MKIKKKEFLSLKQRNMSVSECHDIFIQLSRYAPDEVVDDERKKEHFIEGLNGPLQCALVAHTFPSFQRLLDKALAIEHKQQTPTFGKGFSIARVNQVSVEATTNGADIAIGMFYIHAIPAAILFDSRAMHSFNSGLYATTNELSLQTMQNHYP
jgi:hypothetical protein